MMASLLSVRAYLLIGIVTAFIVYILMLVLGGDVAAWGRQFRSEALFAGQGGFGRTLADPLIYIAENGVVGAAIAGLLWPFIIIWIILTLVLLVIVASADVTRDTTSIIQLFL